MRVHAYAADKMWRTRMIPSSINPYLISASESEETAPSTSPLVAGVNDSENSVDTTDNRQITTTLPCTHLDQRIAAAMPGLWNIFVAFLRFSVI